MSTQSHNGTTGAKYLSRVATVVPSVRALKSLNTSRTKRHTLNDARQAVSEKLRQNIAYLRDPKNVEQPDLVYKIQQDGLYAVGIKYGNRWLKNVFGETTYLQVNTPEQVCELMELFADDVIKGEFDECIIPIMEANIDARKK
ncbi:hypothetical protein [Leptothrix discophora]|uniref:Uncharacterized protein n=1 Tax=Leptothrix discophora TaxID=89 RepID=A0ABT9G161_LEPDI|nr:hypothetical protein [Leptothrix discophora]MDP4300217.1 hypothetical protein [Leptothrix discophora]